MNDIGDKFHQQTKYHPQKMPRHMLNWAAQPTLYKQYTYAPRIDLPAPKVDKPASLNQTLKQRKSIRDFQEAPIGLDHLSYLLWASTGIQRIEAGYEFRTAPSAGALYPIETYVIANNIEGLAAGLYHYAIKDHYLEQLKEADLRNAITVAALEQSFCATAAIVFVWTAIFQRCKWKYGQRAYRYIYLDAGHIAQNLALAAVSLNLGSCEIGALYDDQVNKILDIDGTDESVICMAVVGCPA
jgi:SagB-type dehydrogenase family enzyme